MLFRKEKKILILVKRYSLRKSLDLGADFSDEESILSITSPPFHPLDGEFAGFRWAFAMGQSLERNSRDSRVRESSSGRFSKLTSFAPLTKRRAILSWILSFRNLIEPHHGGSAGRRTIVELLSSLTNHRVTSEHPFSMISARVRRDISNRENRGGVSGSRGRSNSSN